MRLPHHQQLATMAAEAGFAGLGTVEGYAATLFALLAVPGRGARRDPAGGRRG